MAFLLRLFCIFLFSGGVAAFSQSPLLLDAREERYPIREHLTFFSDSVKTSGIEEIRNLSSSGQFYFFPDKFANFGVNAFSHWYAFTLFNPIGTKELIFRAFDPYLSETELFIYHRGELYYKKETNGWRTPISERPVPFQGLAFPLVLESPGEYECYFRFIRETGTVKGTVFLEQRDVFFRKLNFETHISSLVQGAVLFLSLFGLFLFFRTRDRLYLWYSLQNVSLLLFIMARMGILNFYMLGRFDLLAGNYSNYLLALLYALSHLFFLTRFLQIKQTMGVALHRVVKGLMIFEFILILLAGSDFLEKSKYYMMYGAIIATALVIVAVIITGFRRGNSNVKIYALAETPFLLIILYYMSGLFLPLPTDSINLYGLQLGPLFEVSVLAVALSDRFGRFQRENNILLKRLNETQKQIIEVQDEERQRIARDLHDELGGNLAAIKMALQSSALKRGEIVSLVRLIDEASMNTRTIAHDLMPPDFQEIGLLRLLDGFFGRLENRNGIAFSFHSFRYDSTWFSRQQELNMYRVIMELVNNIIRHSGASEATVQLIGYDNHLALMAEDNGRGFSRDLGKGLGLRSIRSRVEFLGGEIAIDTGASGTTIIIRVPVGSS